jgi:CBS domain-containing protein
MSNLTIQEKAMFTINPEHSAFDALEKIELNGFGTVVVIKGDKVIGTVSDGDIRKILLSHHMLTIPVREVMNQNFVSICEGKISAGDEIFRSSFFIRLLPIVDQMGNLKGLLRRS